MRSKSFGTLKIVDKYYTFHYFIEFLSELIFRAKYGRLQKRQMFGTFF